MPGPAGVSRSGRSTASRSPSRICRRRRGSAPPSARPSSPTSCPTRDSLLVERLRRAGAVIVGKTNTPEFGAGSQTFNPVFGPTRNPWDPTRTCGGSSGGAATALAAGFVPLADGSDMGGSLRNPASFCNVVGLRPSPGRVPIWPSINAWFTLSVDGPMARSVADAALLLSAIAGPDARSPIALDEPGARFAEPLGPGLPGDPDRVVRRSWPSLEPGGADGGRSRPAAARRPGRGGGGRGPRLPRGRFRLQDLAGLGLRGPLGLAPSPASRPDQGHGRGRNRARARR